MIAKHSKRIRVIFRGFFERRDLGFAQVDSDRMTGPTADRSPLGQLSRDCFRAGIVEAHPVDQCFVSNGSEHARSRIAGLRMPGHPPEFTETESENFPHGYCRRLFIHARGEADRIGEGESEELNGQLRRPP